MGFLASSVWEREGLQWREREREEVGQMKEGQPVAICNATWLLVA